jgi:hypothetical protein
MTTMNGDSIITQSDYNASLIVSGKRKRSDSLDELSSVKPLAEVKQYDAFPQRLQNALPLLRK